MTGSEPNVERFQPQTPEPNVARFLAQGPEAAPKRHAGARRNQSHIFHFLVNLKIVFNIFFEIDFWNLITFFEKKISITFLFQAWFFVGE